MNSRTVTVTLQKRTNDFAPIREGDIIRMKTWRHLLGHPVVKSKSMVAKIRGKKFVPKYKTTSCNTYLNTFNTTLTPFNF